MSAAHRKARGPLTLLSTSRKARWTAAVMALPGLYVLSLGPLAWLLGLPRTQLLVFPASYYCKPYTLVAEYLPSQIRWAIECYLHLWA